MSKPRIYLSVVLLLAVHSAHGEITTSIGAKMVYDDNPYRLESREVDLWITKINPGVDIEIETGAATYGLGLSAESGTYSQSWLGDDDYTDYEVDAEGEWKLSSRNRFQVGANNQRGHDERGMGRMDVVGKLPSLTNFAEPDEWTKNGFDAKYTYGSPEAKGALTLEGSYEDTDYTNNKPTTNRLDKETTELIAQAFLKVMPKTSVFVEARVTDIEYDINVPDRDSEENRYYFGVEWTATAKTTGSLRFGVQEKEPDDSTQKTFNSTAWELDMVWAPRSYSSLELSAFRGVEDSASATTFVDRETYRLAWAHSWGSRLTSEVFVSRDSQDYKNVTRSEYIESFGFSADYELMESLILSSGYVYEDRNSTIAGLDFRRNVVTFGANVEFE